MLRVCKVSEIKDDSLNRFHIEKQDILIGKRNGKLFACSNICPHKQALMHKGWFNGNNVVCYMHYYEFDIGDGKLAKIHEKWDRQSPVWRKSGDLSMFDIIVKNDEIYVESKT